MTKFIHPRPRDNDEKGFTLIELMVVVLIIGILMAIAIPTFLSVTKSSKANAAEADLTTAVQDEQLFFTASSNGTTGYGGAGDMRQADPGINWQTCNGDCIQANPSGGDKTVWVVESNLTDQTNPSVILGTVGQDGKVYWVNDRQGQLTYAFQTVQRNNASGAPGSDRINGNTWKNASQL